MGLGMLIVVGPWTVRNYVHHGRLVFVASEGGVTFWTGNHPLAVGDEPEVDDAQRGEDLADDPGLLGDLADGGVLGRLARLDVALGQAHLVHAARAPHHVALKQQQLEGRA